MKFSHIKLVVLVFCIIVSTMPKEPLQLFYVSTNPENNVSPMSGSVKGGTRIYINGVGFNTIAENHIVYVGGKLCDMTKAGVNTNFLTCDTTDSGSPSDLLNQAITVKIPATNEQVTLDSPKFAYKKGSTPYLNFIYPRSAHALSEIRFNGVHRIMDLGDGRDLGDIIGLKIGNNMCGRFDIAQDAINPNKNNNIICKQSGRQEGGKYNVSEHVLPGYASNSKAMRKPSFINEYYEFSVMPTILGVSSHSGSNLGDILTITGTGFSSIPSKVAVTVDNTPCIVSVASTESISCEISERPSNEAGTRLNTDSISQVKGFISGSGF